MGKESIIAQVDSSTEQIMRDISNGITSAIDENLQDIKDDTRAIEDIVERTEEITLKLSRFDGLSSSLADLKTFAEESKQLSEKISPIESLLIDLHESISSIHTVISSVEKTQSNKFAEVSEALRDAKENSLNFNETTLQSTLQAIRNENDRMNQSITAVSQKLKEVDTFAHQKTDDLNTRIESLHTEIQAFSQQNEAQLNILKESVDKVQVTLDVVVNLTTPFWKKWGK
jgi:uncharacterized protein YukE